MNKFICFAIILFSVNCSAATNAHAVDDKGNLLEMPAMPQESLEIDMVEVKAVSLEPLIRSVLKEIYAKVSYPPRALYKKMQGTAVVRFTISRETGVKNVEIIKSTGKELLDSTIVKAINKLNKDVIAERYGNDDYDFQVPVGFTIKVTDS